MRLLRKLYNQIESVIEIYGYCDVNGKIKIEINASKMYKTQLQFYHFMYDRILI